MKKNIVFVLIGICLLLFISCSTFSGRKKVPLVLNGVKTFHYPTSESVEPSADILDYLYSATFHLKENPSIRINIIGHSDNTGSYEEDINKAIKRAEKCYDYLLSLDIEKYNIMYSGMGNMSPVSRENTDEAKAKNRRIEIKFVTME